MRLCRFVNNVNRSVIKKSPLNPESRALSQLAYSFRTRFENEKGINSETLRPMFSFGGAKETGLMSRANEQSDAFFC